MPYIDQGARPEIDGLVDPLADALNAAGGNDAMVGKLNYAVSRLAWRLCGHGSGERRYARMNAVGGALFMALQEFYRRIAAPYEDEKIAQAGDVSESRGGYAASEPPSAEYLWRLHAACMLRRGWTVTDAGGLQVDGPTQQEAFKPICDVLSRLAGSPG